MADHNIKLSIPVIEKTLDMMKGFLEKVIGPSANELGEQFADGMRLRRLKNQIRSLSKIKDMVDKEGVDVKQVDLKVLVPYLQNVSLEEDENLQEKWANLFVNYIDTNKNLATHVYPSILAQLSSDEVRIIDDMYKSNRNLYREGYTKNGIPLSEEQLENLVRLGIVSPNQNFSLYDVPHNPKIEELLPWEYYLSRFGCSFVEACNRQN